MTSHLRTLLDGLEEEAVILEPMGQVVYANAAWLRRHGLSLDEVVGHRALDLPSLTPSPLPNLELAQQTWASGEPQRSGAGNWEVLSSPISNLDGECTRVVQVRRRRGHNALPESAWLPQTALPLPQAISPALNDLPAAARACLEGLVALGQGVGAGVHRLDPETQALSLVAHRGLEEQQARALGRWSRDEPWLAPALQGEIVELSRPDTDVWPRGLGDAQAARIVPLLAHEQCMGLLSLLAQEPDLPDASISSSSVALALAQLFWQAQALVRSQAALRQAAIYNDLLALMAGSRPSEGLLRRVMERCVAHLGAEGSVILLYEAEYHQLVSHAESAVGINPGEVRPFRIPLDSEKLSAHIFRTGEPFCSNAPQQDPRLRGRSFLPEDIRSLISVPLCTQDGPIGVLHLINKEAGDFGPDDVQLISHLAPHVAAAIESDRRFHVEQAQREIADALREAAQPIDSPPSREEIPELLLQRLGRVIEHDRAVIVLADESRERLIAGRGFPPGCCLDRSPADQVLEVHHEWLRQRLQPIVLADVQQDERWTPLVEGEPIRSHICAPILFQERMIGSLHVDKVEPGYYRQEHADLLSLFASHASTVLENTRLLQEERERAAQLRLLSGMGQRLLTFLDRDEVLAYVVQAICDLLEYNHAEVYLIEEYLRNAEAGDIQAEYVVFQAASGLDQAACRRLRSVRYQIGEEGIIGHVAATGEPYLAADVEHDPYFLPNPLLPHIGSELAVPIKIAGQVVGVLDLSSARPAAFDSSDLVVMQTLADQLALGLENARLFEAERQRRQELESIQATAAALSAELDRGSLLDKVAAAAAAAFRAEATSLMLLNAQDQVLAIQASSGLSEAYIRQRRIPLQSVRRAYDERVGWQSMIVHDPSSRPFGDRELMSKEGIESVLSVPLLEQGELIGALNIYSKDPARRFTSAEMGLAEAFAAQASVAFHNATLYQAIQAYAGELSARADRLALIARISSAVNSLDLGQILDTAETEMAQAFGVEHAGVILADHPVDHALSRLEGDVLDWLQAHKRPLRVAASQAPRLDARQPSSSGTDSESTGQQGGAWLVPLIVRDELIGLIRLSSIDFHGEEKAFDADELSLAQTIANQVAMAIANAQFFSLAGQRVRELTTFSEVSRLLANAGDLPSVLDIVLDYAFTLVGHQEGSIILIDPPDGDTLRIVASRGIPVSTVDEFNTRPVYTWQGTFRRALESGQIVEVVDTSQDPDFLQDVGSVAQQLTNVPLRIETGPIGLIAVDGLPENEDVRRLLLGMADMAAVAIERARLYERTERQLAEVSTLYTLADQLTRNLSTASVLETIVTVLKMTLNCRACSIFLLDESKQVLRLAASCGVAPPWDHVAQLQVGEGISGRVISSQQPYYVADTREDPSFVYFNPDIRSLLVVPLIVRGKAIGTLSIDDLRPFAFAEETHLLSIAAAQASVAIENAQLFENMEQKAHQLREAYESLKELDQLKDELVQNISHELRTPLTFIRGYVELLLEGVMGPLQTEQEHALDVVLEKTRGLTRLVEDIMKLQQSAGVGFEPEPVSLVEVGTTALKGAFAGANAAGLTLVDELPDDLPWVMGDAGRLGQVLDNLLSNAIKFTLQGGQITLRMQAEPDLIRVEVEDTGVGIPEDQLDRVFERFYQVDGSSTRRYGGTGLGLAIVKQFVEQHGGNVGVRSQPGQGSTFFFTLPRFVDIEERVPQSAEQA